MSLTVTFFAFDVDGSVKVIRRTIIPDDALMVYQSSPEIALTIVENGGPPRPDRFRVIDDRGRKRVTFSQPRKL